MTELATAALPELLGSLGAALLVGTTSWAKRRLTERRCRPRPDPPAPEAGPPTGPRSPGNSG
ncbi:hypothetical protein LG634_22985 [Streptomyces bambusae]|uniref:hypothetical protein n=1 Tax=Streptomyces bambusae TaxID=1550616 RepID=UPI001CFE11F2|nr:hypothetical protein [Streptomyces bambusae]MCB5167683.1 hypothetical protein [Streptomyces bambusae]